MRGDRAVRPGSRSWWLVIGAYVLALFAVQPFLGFAVDAFKERWGEGALEAAVWVVAGLAGSGMVVGLARVWRGASPLERFTVAVGVALYVLGVTSLEIPQERLHYVEYGLLAGLVYAGLAASPARRRWESAIYAFSIVAGLGYLDEELQGRLWERRYFDWLDVALNARAAALGVWLAIPITGALRRGSRGEGRSARS